MKRVVGVIACFLAIAVIAHDVRGHGVAKVRKELTEQGYVDLEFQRTRPPFKLDACKDGTIYHLHVDFYGKITEKKAIGDCRYDEPVASQDDDTIKEDDPAGTEQPDSDTPSRITDDARSRGWRYWGKDYGSDD